MEDGESKGLIALHCYSVIKVDKISNPRTYQIQLRNPHGRNEWKGQWSDKEDTNEGEFFLSFEEFLKFFGTVDVCHVNNHNNSHFFEFHGDWKYASFMNHGDFSKLIEMINFNIAFIDVLSKFLSASVATAPKFYIELKQPTSLLITLSQHYENRQSELDFIGFNLVHLNSKKDNNNDDTDSPTVVRI